MKKDLLKHIIKMFLKYKQFAMLTTILLLSLDPLFSNNTYIDTSICIGSDLKILIPTEENTHEYNLLNSKGDILINQNIEEGKNSFIIKSDWLVEGTNKFILNTSNSSYLINVLAYAEPSTSIIGDFSTCPNKEEVIYSTELEKDHSYNWTVIGGEIIDKETNSFVFVNWYGSGIGKIVLTKKDTINGCSSTISKDVVIEDNEKPTIISCPKDIVVNYFDSDYKLEIKDQSFDMKAIDNCELASVVNDFNFASTLEDEVIYDPVNITWTATDKENNTKSCSFTVSFKYIKTLNPPTAFSPNGDGINDTWNIENISMYPNAIVQVRNKNGELIFDSERGYPYNWDGTNNGKELQVDSYYYIIYPGDGIDPLKGLITILK